MLFGLFAQFLDHVKEAFVVDIVDKLSFSAVVIKIRASVTREVGIDAAFNGLLLNQSRVFQSACCQNVPQEVG